MAEQLTKIVGYIPKFTAYRQWLLEGVFFGRAANNNVFQWQFADGDEQWIGITGWVPIHGDKLVWSDQGRLGVRIGATFPHWMADKIESSVEGRVYWFDDYYRSLYTVHNPNSEDGQFEDVRSAGGRFGLGLRSYIYWAWWLKQEAFGWCLDALQRWGAGFEVWEYSEGDPASEAAVRAAAEAQSGYNRILFPRPIGNDKQGPSVHRIEMDGRGLNLIKSFINDYFDNQINRYIIGQNLSSEAAGTGLGSGVADLHASTKGQIIKLDSINLAETLTRELLYPLARFNWPRKQCRVRFVIDVEKPDIEALMEAADLFVKLGGVVDEDHLRSQLGLPKPDQGAAVLGGKPAAPAMADTAAMLAEAA